jgi:hypothetical protein
MVRDIRSMPRGLIAPLTQAQLNSLRDFADAAVPTEPEEYRARTARPRPDRERDGRAGP